MDAGNEARLANLCAIFDIPVESTEPNPELALNVLARMYLVPTIDEKSERNRVLNEIRGQLLGHFDPYSDFTGRTGTVAAFMQELPHWYADLNKPTATLVEMYQGIETGKKILGYVAIGAGATSAGAGSAAAGEYVKTGDARQAAIKGGRRLIGQGPLLEELSKKSVPRLGAARLGAAGVVVAVGATVLYQHANERLEELRAILLDRFHAGDMTDEQYRTVFGTQHDPSHIKKYWEM